MDSEGTTHTQGGIIFYESCEINNDEASKVEEPQSTWSENDVYVYFEIFGGEYTSWNKMFSSQTWLINKLTHLVILKTIK